MGAALAGNGSDGAGLLLSSFVRGEMLASADREALPSSPGIEESVVPSSCTGH